MIDMVYISLKIFFFVYFYDYFFIHLMLAMPSAKDNLFEDILTDKQFRKTGIHTLIKTKKERIVYYLNQS